PLAPGAHLPPYLDRPTGLGWDATRQALWTIDRRAQKLVCVQTSGTVLATINLTSLTLSAGLIDPRDVAVDGGGFIWLTDPAAQRLFQLQSNGTFAASFALGDPDLTNPCGLAFDSGANRLLVSDPTTRKVVAYSLTGQKGT